MVERARGGYGASAYAASLAEFGTPVHLPRSDGWLLERTIPCDGRRDLMGPYPVFDCREWSGLAEDLLNVERAAVSVVLVSDPLADVPAEHLRRAFPDHLVEFKRHLLRDLEREVQLPSHHRRQLRRAARAVDVEVSPASVKNLDDWVDLYAGLVARHRLSGIQAFSRESFRRQLAIPGMLAARALKDDRTVCMTLWLVAGERAYYHLGASSDAGRAVSASYAAFDATLRELTALGVRLVDFGGVAGPAAKEGGLSRFKSGWANAERPALLCGRVLDRPAYESLTADCGRSPRWFPAYRGSDPELGSPRGDVKQEHPREGDPAR